MAFIRGLLGVFVIIVLTVLCVSNMDAVPLKISPIHDALEIPLYGVILGAFLFGFIIGAFMVWLNALVTGWGQRRKIKSLEKAAKKSAREERQLGITLAETDKDLVNKDDMPII